MYGKVPVGIIIAVIVVAVIWAIVSLTRHHARVSETPASCGPTAGTNATHARACEVR